MEHLEFSIDGIRHAAATCKDGACWDLDRCPFVPRPAISQNELDTLLRMAKAAAALQTLLLELNAALDALVSDRG